MIDYVILDEASKEELEKKVNITLADMWFKLLGGVVVYRDNRNRLHFLQTLYKGAE